MTEEGGEWGSRSNTAWKAGLSSGSSVIQCFIRSCVFFAPGWGGFCALPSMSSNPKFTPSGHPNQRIKPHIVSFLYLHPPKLPDFVEITPNSPHQESWEPSDFVHFWHYKQSTTGLIIYKNQTLIFAVMEGKGSKVKIPAGLMSNDTSCLFSSRCWLLYSLWGGWREHWVPHQGRTWNKSRVFSIFLR